MVDARTVITLKEFRQSMKAMGYKVRVKTYSDFKAATVVDAENNNAINLFMMTPAHREKYKAFFNFKNTHAVRDGIWTVTL